MIILVLFLKIHRKKAWEKMPTYINVIWRVEIIGNVKTLFINFVIFQSYYKAYLLTWSE